jgi:hypothetical protein
MSVASEVERGKWAKLGVRFAFSCFFGDLGLSSFCSFVFWDYGVLPELDSQATSICICRARMVFGVDRLRMQLRRPKQHIMFSELLLGLMTSGPVVTWQ